MKTAISIPGPIFEEAENMAQSLGVSRSKLYTKAVVEYLAAHRKEGITDALNSVYEKQESRLESGFMKMQVRAISKEDW